MPYSIPRYEKGPSLWEKALGALLVSAGSAAAQKGTENLMSRDYATAEDGGPATGFSRLLGPKVGERQNEMRQGQQFAAHESELGRQFQTGQHSLSNEEALAAAQLAAQNAQTLENNRAGHESMLQTARESSAQDRLTQELAGGQALARLHASLTDNSPETLAHVGLLKSQGSHYDSQSGFTRHLLDMMDHPEKYKQGGAGAAAGGATMTDADRAAMRAMKGGQAPYAAGTDFVSGPTDIQSYLQQGLSPTDIASGVARQRATDTRAQGMPLVDPAATIDPRLQQLLQTLGMNALQEQDQYMP